MLLITRVLWALAILITLVSSAGNLGQDNAPIPPPTCTDLFIPVTVTATNLFIPVVIDAVNGPVFNVSVHGTYRIGARYCVPGNYIHSRRDVLQILVHGVTYDRNFWFGLNFQSPTFSWVSYASSQGYPTLSIDRLGSGLSDRPNGTTVVQAPVHVEVIESLITDARTGRLPGPMTGIKYSKIIYAGHSYGSVVANAHNVKYPSQIDATILTGYASTYNVPLLQNVMFPAAVPAALEEPTKYASLDASYLMLNSSDAERRLFYYPGGYDPAIFPIDYSLRGTFTTGEITGAILGPLTATQYENPLYIVTGQHDAVFCPELIDGGQGNNCTPTGLSDTKSLYPSVPSKNFGWYAPPNSGHCWQLHYDALSTFAIVHQWLATKGF